MPALNANKLYGTVKESFSNNFYKTFVIPLSLSIHYDMHIANYILHLHT